MFVFIAHTEADQAAADDLKSFLKSRGLVTEAETGARGFRHLQASDVVVALWSQKAVFGAQRMMMEKRMLDAWADGRLVLVKLDHGFLPVGLRDLPTIDASFETGRQLSVWPQVERAARQAMSRALEESGAVRYADGASHRPQGVGSGGLPPKEAAADERWSISRSRPAPPPQPVEIDEKVEAFASKRGSPFGMLAILAAFLSLGAAGWILVQGDAAPVPLWTAAALGAFGILLVLVLGAMVMRPAGPPVVKRVKRAEAASAPATPPSSRPVAEGAAALFISYAHADDAAVAPVVRIVEANGRKVWIDKVDIQSGDGWAGEIVRAIKAAGGILVMCSPRAFESDHIKREVYLADRYKKPMLPVFLEPAQMPEDFEFFFAGVQWLELFRLPEADRPGAIGKALSSV